MWISTDSVLLALCVCPDVARPGQHVAAWHSWQRPTGITDQVLYNSSMQNEMSLSGLLRSPLARLCL